MKKLLLLAVALIAFASCTTDDEPATCQYCFDYDPAVTDKQAPAQPADTNLKADTDANDL